MTAVHVVQYENNDPNTVRVVPWNWNDFESKAFAYNETDSARLQRDSFVVQHTDLIRRRPKMDNEFDRQAYWDHHESYDPQPVWLSGKGTRSKSGLDSVQDKLNSLALSTGDPPLYKLTQTRKFNLDLRKEFIKQKKPDEEEKKECDALCREWWEDYRLLCGKDKRRLLADINGTLPNLGKMTSVFVFILDEYEIEMEREGSGCIISDDGRFVLTAGHVVDSSFDRRDIMKEISLQLSDEDEKKGRLKLWKREQKMARSIKTKTRKC